MLDVAHTVNAYTITFPLYCQWTASIGGQALPGCQRDLLPIKIHFPVPDEEVLRALDKGRPSLLHGKCASTTPALDDSELPSPRG